MIVIGALFAVWNGKYGNVTQDTQEYVVRCLNMKNKIYIGLLLIAFIFQGSILQVEASQINYKSAEFKAVASQFACTCGCGQDHYECDPNTCNLTTEFKKTLSR